MMRPKFLDRLTNGPLLADGAMGTMLHAHGIGFDQCFDELNLTNTVAVAEVHREYIEAGAQVILTNTFGSNRYKLSKHGLGDKVSRSTRPGWNWQKTPWQPHSRTCSSLAMWVHWECGSHPMAVCN